MIHNIKLAVFALAIVVAGVLIAFMPCFAATHWPTHHPYRFEVADPVVHAGEDVSVTFRLIQNSTGKTISGAVITEPKLEMLRQDAEPVPGQINELAPNSQGNYLFRGNLTTAGDWELQFYFQIPDEEAPIHGTLMIHVVQ